MNFDKPGIYLTEGGCLVKIVYAQSGILSTSNGGGELSFNWYGTDGGLFYTDSKILPHGAANLKLKCLTNLKELPTLPEGKNPLNEKYGKCIVVLEKPENNSEYIPLISNGIFGSSPKYATYHVAESQLDGLRPLVVLKENEDWVEITNPNHIMRENIDWVKCGNNNWEKVIALAGLKRGNYPNFGLRCLRKDLPMEKDKFRKDGIYLTENGYLVQLQYSPNGFLYVDVNDIRYGFFTNGKCHGHITDTLFGGVGTSLKELTALTELPKPPAGYKWTSEFNKKYGDKIVKLEKPSGNFIAISATSLSTRFINVALLANEVPCVSSIFDGLRPLVTRIDSTVESVQNIVSVKKEEEVMSNESTPTAEQVKTVAKTVAKTAGNIALRTVNYWLVGPAVEYVSRIVRSVRYVTFLGIVGGSIYGYYNPDAVVSLVKKCVPKITIEAPEIMQG